MKTFRSLATSCAALTRPSVWRANPALSARLLSRHAPVSSFHRRLPHASAIIPLQTLRHTSTSTTPPAPDQATSTTSTGTPPDRNAELPRQTPAYKLAFTCKPCKKSSVHLISKQGYHKGTVLITCPKCRNRHLISDHLKVLQTPHTSSQITVAIGES